ncbi:polyphenol oxidase [Stachybotrys elegans]|uniref:Polyphenol oxidase n=1 Tax=Stachybotrys elegans TaxID=80388 RepID=A0A8K0WNP9_9HYPO|nr:polyphenol oxidase [Stachybotrys elegans]
MLSKTLGAVALSLLFGGNAVEAKPVPGTTPASAHLFRRAQLSPQYPMFSVEMPIPPVKEPKLVTTNPANGREMRYYEIEIQGFSKQVYPGLSEAEFVGYDGISPGPTIRVPRGVESVVRFVNNANQNNSVHLHGSFSRAAFDGWAEDMTQPGEYKDYYYPNRQSGRTLWYHDHAMHLTAENAYKGQAGMYIIDDEAEHALNLPEGDYDWPMILASKQFNADGTLAPATGLFFGDVIHVNGEPWPFANVEPRKYRFRFLDAAVTRSFGLYFANSEDLTTRIPFQVIASDSGLLEHPVETELLYISMAERYDVVFDFSGLAGQTIDLRNLAGQVGGIGTDTDYDNSDKVMRFHVAEETENNEPDNSDVPENLRSVPYPTPTDMEPKDFVFNRTNNVWTINGARFSDPVGRLLANVSTGTVQRWRLINTGAGWTHPIHIHLVDFRIISRTNTGAQGTGRDIMPYETGLKDVVWLGRQETVVVEAHYAPFPGLYMFHCHNLIHEDTDMMAAFNTTVLPDYGYNATIFTNPMEEMWQAVPFEITEFDGQSGAFSDSAIISRLHAMAEYLPYQAADDEAEN